MTEQDVFEVTGNETPAAVVEKSNAVLDVNGAADSSKLKLGIYPEEHRALVAWLYDAARENGWSWDVAQEKSKISRTALYRVWSGTYVNTSTGAPVSLAKFCEKIARFKKLYDARAGVAKSPFVETSVWFKVSDLCTEALNMNTIAFVVGDSQIGKTTALKEFEKRNRGTAVYVLLPAAGNKTAMLQAIANACGVDTEVVVGEAGEGRRLRQHRMLSFETLRAKVLEKLNENMVLLCDELHEVFNYESNRMKQCLAVLRQIHDETHCGMVLAGTSMCREAFEKGKFAMSLQQLRRRGIWMLQLESTPKVKDLVKIASFFGLPELPREGEVWDNVCWVREQMGLGMYVKFLERGHKRAAGKGQKFSWQHFMDVFRASEKMKRMEKLEE